MANILRQYERQNNIELNVRESQIDFGLKVKRDNIFDKIENKLEDLERRLEVMPFWKNFSFVFAAVTSILFPAGVIATMVYKFNYIPTKMQLFFNPDKQSWELVDKSIVIFVPIIFAIVNLILLNITYTVFQFDRRLAQVIGIILCINNILFVIAFAEILSLALV